MIKVDESDWNGRVESGVLSAFWKVGNEYHFALPGRTDVIRCGVYKDKLDLQIKRSEAHRLLAGALGHPVDYDALQAEIEADRAKAKAKAEEQAREAAAAPADTGPDVN